MGRIGSSFANWLLSLLPCDIRKNPNLDLGAFSSHRCESCYWHEKYAPGEMSKQSKVNKIKFKKK